MKEYIYLIIIAILLLAIIFLVFFQMKKKDDKDDLDDVSKKIELSLKDFQYEINENLNNKINNLTENNNIKFNNLQNEVNNKLTETLKSTTNVYQDVLKEMKELTANQTMLQSLSSNITSLNNVLTDKKNRGTYGEIELYSILKQCYGDDESFYKKQYKLSNGLIVDAVLFASEPLNIIPIDSKFPLENYNRMYDNSLSIDEQERASKLFKSDCIKHINDIHDKYVLASETCEFAYMFIPAEAIFAEIYGHFSDVIQHGYKNNVYIVSPTTLIAYITAIKAIYLGQKKNEKAKEIQEQLISLGVEFNRFKNRWDNFTNDINRVNNDIDDINKTSKKIVNRFDSINKVEFEQIETKGDGFDE